MAFILVRWLRSTSQALWHNFTSALSGGPVLDRFQNCFNWRSSIQSSLLSQIQNSDLPAFWTEKAAAEHLHTPHPEPPHTKHSHREEEQSQQTQQETQQAHTLEGPSPKLTFPRPAPPKIFHSQPVETDFPNGFFHCQTQPLRFLLQPVFSRSCVPLLFGSSAKASLFFNFAILILPQPPVEKVFMHNLLFSDQVSLFFRRRSSVILHSLFSDVPQPLVEP